MQLLDLMTLITSCRTGSLISSLGLNSYAEYSLIFGPVVYEIGWPVRDQGETPLLNRKPKLNIPNQTRTLKNCVAGFLIGWAVLDQEQMGYRDLCCASIHRWDVDDKVIASSPQHSFHKIASEQGQHVDVLILERISNLQRTTKDGPQTYRCIGRGRVVKKGWLTEQIETWLRVL
jgi:hypothetical protein